MLRGARDLVARCKERIAHEPHELSADKRFSWEEVECLGSCANAPLVQIGSDTYEDLTSALLDKVLDGFATGAASYLQPNLHGMRPYSRVLHKSQGYGSS